MWLEDNGEHTLDRMFIYGDGGDKNNNNNKKKTRIASVIVTDEKTASNRNLLG